MAYSKAKLKNNGNEAEISTPEKETNFICYSENLVLLNIESAIYFRAIGIDFSRQGT
jgi:hypothetical protein